MHQLLDALDDPGRCASLDDAGWDRLVRCARAARLLGSLSARLSASGVADRVPEAPARHLRAAMAEAKYLRQMSLRQLALIAETLRPLAVTVVALKGSAYILGGLSCAQGRLPRDIDLLVPRHRLDEVEQALGRAGWTATKSDAYDQRYYRDWSHELPPMRAPSLPLELDIHHAILPPIGRLKPDSGQLIGNSVAVPDSFYRLLRPADLLLHAAVHLFQDSDCVDRLRDLVDIDALAREFAHRDGDRFWGEVLESSARHGLGRPLWYALGFARGWMRTPVPDEVTARVAAEAPPLLCRSFLPRLAARVLGPVDPDREASNSERAAAAALSFRALWLRMPPWTLAYHAANRFIRERRRVRGRSIDQADPETNGEGRRA